MTSEYTQQRLRRHTLPADPFELFADWREAAAEAEPWHGAAMVLSTVGADGFPSARVVLLRGVAEGAFQFFTNYGSRKGIELAGNPACSLVFWWPSLVRQVRIEGLAARLPDAVSDDYFASRPRASQIGAWASPQSAVIESRAALSAHVVEMEARFADTEVPRPPNWGGYGVIPRQIEFWQGGEARLHDRFRYARVDGGADAWVITRLAP
jgi:pyridoxamine 5'-phosphate oxidase